jgi:predicted nucleic acid-binding protein
MAASPVLVDSCFYIQALREGRDPLRALALPAMTQDLVVCGVVRCEVGRGLRDKRVWQRFQSFWDVMINVPTDNRIWTAAEDMLWRLDRQGITLPLTDVVIACCAIRAEAVVLTLDRHFHQIPGVRVINRIEY